jgi:competence protein ComEA
MAFFTRHESRPGVSSPVDPSGAPWRALEAEEPAKPTPDVAPRGVPWVAIGAVVVAVVVAAAALLLSGRSDSSIEVDGAVDDAASTAVTGAHAPSPSATTDRLVVEVGGAVVKPGVYRLPAGSRVGDAVAAAGGYGPRVDAVLADRQLNLAAPLHDGDEVHVPVRGEAAGPANGGDSGGAGGGSGSGGGGPIDLNRATAEQLDTLPGIGPVTAAKIIAAREEKPFASIDDLGTRKVLGAATLDKIRSLVTVGQ